MAKLTIVSNSRIIEITYYQVNNDTIDFRANAQISDFFIEPGIPIEGYFHVDAENIYHVNVSPEVEEGNEVVGRCQILSF